MIKAAIYIRISTDDQSDYSLDKQERDCRAEAERRGWHVHHIYTDEGISAKNDKRPALRQLQADIISKKVQAIIVHKTDRLMRNLRLLLGFIEVVRDHNASFISIMENIDLTSPMGWAMFQVQGVFSELYINNLREETRKGLTEKAQQGKWVGGISPYGYRRVDKDTIAPGDDADLVREMFVMYATGNYSYTRLADEMNARGVRHFRTEGVRDIISNRAYCGFVSSGQEFPGRHEALITLELWQRCAAIREARSGGAWTAEMTKLPSDPQGLLLNIGRCADCNQPLWQHRSGNSSSRNNYYRCAGNSRRNCLVKMQRMDVIDDQVLDMLRGFVYATDWQHEALKRLKGRAPVRVRRPSIDRVALEQKLERYTEIYADGNLTRDQYLKRCADIKRQLEQAEEQIEAEPLLDLDKAAKLLPNLGRLIDHATLDERRALIQIVFSSFWIMETQIHAVQPQVAYGVLLEEMRRQTIRQVDSKRETGLEPATFCLGNRCATIALFPPAQKYTE